MKKDRTWLKNLRKSKGMTRPQLAKEFGIATSTSAMFEDGRRRKDMSIATAQKLAAIFNVPIEYVLEQETKVS